MEFPSAEPYRIKMVEPIRRRSRGERARIIAEAKYNLFNIKAEDVYIDLLTDSGTGAMSSAQWAEMMLGDESYAGRLVLLQAQGGRARDHGFRALPANASGASRRKRPLLDSARARHEGAGKVVPGNAHFDTTKGHIEFRKAPRPGLHDRRRPSTPNSDYPFKGNVDLGKLESALSDGPPGRVPLCLLTVTCNSSGGQPVSMANIRAVSELCHAHGVPLFLDAARFAENAYFIRKAEAGYAERPIREIAREMFGYADGCTMSSKKDGLVNIGASSASATRLSCAGPCPSISCTRVLTPTAARRAGT